MVTMSSALSSSSDFRMRVSSVVSGAAAALTVAFLAIAFFTGDFLTAFVAFLATVFLAFRFSPPLALRHATRSRRTCHSQGPVAHSRPRCGGYLARRHGTDKGFLLIGRCAD